MTSTSFNIGMSGERASSKVLKPPGGGTSDIFGGSEPAAAVEKPIVRKKSAQTSSIVLSDNVTTNGNGSGGPTENGHSNSNSKQDAPVAPKPTVTNGRATNGEVKQAVAAAPTAPRNRVPPGGYSSGLW